MSQRILRSVTFIPSSYPTWVWNFDRNVRKRRPAKILLHLCGNLLVTYFVFVAGISSTGNPDLCTAVAAILQYFFLSSWSWMAVYAYDMYMSVVRVSEQHYYFLITILRLK